MPYSSDYAPPRSAATPARPAQRMDGNTRLIIVGGTVALAVYFGWPFLRGAFSDAGDQLRVMGNHSAVEPWDPFGLRPAAPSGPGQGEGRYRRCQYDGARLTCGGWIDGSPPTDGRIVRPGENPDLDRRYGQGRR